MKKSLIATLIFSAALVTPAMAVSAVPAHANAVEKADFLDVPKTHPMYKEIMTMRTEGVINGYQDNSFKPSQAITRANVAALFVRSLDLKPIRAGKEFKDVPASSAYYENVQTVYRAGIFDGNADGTFGISDKLTRAQMSKVLVNAFGLKVEKGYIFEDIAENHWYKDYVATLYVNGITAGSKGKYMPNQTVTRAQYATFLYRALHPEQVTKPTKPLQSKPPVVKPAPPAEPTNAPPGAKLIKDDKNGKTYSYPQTLSAGGEVSTVKVNDVTVYITLTYKKDTFHAEYVKSREILAFVMRKPDIGQGSINDLYDIAETFIVYEDK